MSKIYYVVEYSKGWDWEREEVVAATLDEEIAEVIKDESTKAIDQEACERCDYRKWYEVHNCPFINTERALNEYIKEELT